jgi:mono/diheme cytochrome c family protein
MFSWRILICILFATSVHAALPVGSDSGPQGTEWRTDWRSADGWRRRIAATADAGPEQRSRLVRHRTYMIEGVPADYQGAASPIERSQTAIIAGATLYAQHCAACHGPKGRGSGDAGRTLKPSPALKTYISRRPWAADEYLLWSVAEGGVEFGSTMPAFREQLTRRQMWEIIAYMRAGFPRSAESGTNP